MAWWNYNYQTKTNKNKWSSLVNSINSDQEVQRMLTRQATNRSSRDAEMIAAAKATTSQTISQANRLNAQQSRQAQQQRDYRTAYNERKPVSRYGINEEQEIARFKRRSLEMAGDRQKDTGFDWDLATEEERRAKIDAEGPGGAIRGPDEPYISEQVSDLYGGRGGTVDSITTPDKFTQAFPDKEFDVSITQEGQLIAALKKLNLNELEQDQMYAVFHKNSIINAGIFGYQDQQLVEAIRAGDFTRIDEIGDGGVDRRKKLVEGSRRLLADTIPGVGFNMDEQDPVIYEPLDWKSLANKPEFSMLIQAMMEGKEYVFHIGTNPITGEKMIIDNTEAKLSGQEPKQGEEENFIRGKTLAARHEVILMLMLPDERTKFIEEYWTTHINQGFAPNEIPVIPVFANMLTQLSKEWNDSVYEKYVKWQATGGMPIESQTGQTDFGAIASLVMSPEDLEIGTMLMGLSGGFTDKAPIPAEITNSKKAHQSAIDRANERYHAGEITYDEAYSLIEEQQGLLDKLITREGVITEQWKPTAGFSENQWAGVETRFANAIEWYDAHTTDNARIEAYESFSIRGIAQLAVDAATDPGGESVLDRFKKLGFVAIPYLDEIMNDWIAGGTLRLAKELGYEPDEDAIFAAKARDEQLMQEVKMYENLLQLNGTMTEKGFEDWALSNIGGAYIGGKFLVDVTEAGYTEVGHPLGEFIMPIIGDLIYMYMYPLEQVWNLGEKGLQWEMDALGIPGDVVGIGGISESVRKAVSGDVDLFFGIDSTEIAGEGLNPANFFFIIPFLGAGSKFGTAVKAGRFIDAAAIFVDEMIATGHSPELLRGALSGIEGFMMRGISETFLANPGLKTNNILTRWMMNYATKRHGQATATALKVSNKTAQDRSGIRILLETGMKNGDESVQKALANYPTSLVDSVRHEINPEISSKFKQENFFNYTTIEKGGISVPPARLKNYISMGLDDASFRVDFTPQYQRVLAERRAIDGSRGLVAESQREWDRVLRPFEPGENLSSSGRHFVTPELERVGYVSKGINDPFAYLAENFDEKLTVEGAEILGDGAVRNIPYKVLPDFFPNLSKVYGNYKYAVKETGQRAVSEAEKVVAEAATISADELTVIKALTPSELAKERQALEYNTSKVVLEGGANPSDEQRLAFQKIAKRLEAITDEQEARYASRPWREGLNNSADSAATKKRYEEVAQDLKEAKLKTMSDEEINQRYVDLLIEAEYRGGHPEQRFDDVLSKREKFVYMELANIEETLVQRGYTKNGIDFIKGETKLGFADQKYAGRIAAELEQAQRGAKYSGSIVGGIKNTDTAKLIAVRDAALAARRDKTGKARENLDVLLDDIANVLGNRRRLEAASRPRIHEVDRRLLPADSDALRAEGSGEGAALPRMDDVDVSPEGAVSKFTLRNLGDEEAVTIQVTESFTDVTLSGGLKIKARRDPDTGGIFIETIQLGGGKKAIRQLEDGLWELKIMADDQDIIIRGWVQPFGRGKSRVGLDDAFDIFERNGYYVERENIKRSGIFVDDAMRPYKEFEYRPVVKDSNIPQPKEVDISKNFEDTGDITNDFIDVNEIVLPGMEPRSISTGMVTSPRPPLGKTANGVWEGTLEEAKANLKLVTDDLFGADRGLATARLNLTAEEGRQLRHQWAKWNRIVENGGVENGRLEYLWNIQNTLEHERASFKARFTRHTRAPEDDAITTFRKALLDDPDEPLAPRAIAEKERISQKTVSDRYDELDELFEVALEDNYKAIKIAESGRTFSEQNVVAHDFEVALKGINDSRPRLATGKKGFLKFTAEREGEGGGKTIGVAKSLEDLEAQKTLVDKEVIHLEAKKIPQDQNYARNEPARAHALEQFEDYQSRLDETLTRYRKDDKTFVNVAPESVEVRELTDAEKYADEFLLDPNRGDFGSSSMQEKVLVSDNRVGAGTTAGPLSADEEGGKMFDEITDAMIKRAQEMTGNQKRTIYVRGISNTESTTNMREISVFGVTAKGKRTIEEGLWNGKDVGFPKDVPEFIKFIDGKTFKGNKKAFIDDLFKKNIIESSWSPGQKGRMQLLRQDAARLDVIGAKPTNLQQRFFYDKTYEDLIEGIAYEVSNGIGDLGNQVGRKMEAMNITSKNFPQTNSLMLKDGTFIDIGNQAPTNVINDAWNQMGAKNPDWDEIKQAALIHADEEQAGKVTAALHATGFISITKQTNGIKIEVIGGISREQASSLKKLINDGDFAVVDLVHGRVYGQKIDANSHLAKLKVKTDRPKGIRSLTDVDFEAKGFSVKSTAKEDLDKAVDNLVTMEATTLKERVARLDGVVDEAESFGTLPPNYSSNGNVTVQTQLIKNGPGRTFDGNTPISDGTGIIFPDGTIWLDRPTRAPLPVKGKRTPKTLVGTTKDGVRSAFGASYDMTEQEMDEFFIEFLNTTGGMRFSSVGGEVKIIVNRPPSAQQLRSFMALKNPDWERKGYTISIKASDGAHTEKMIGPRMNYDDFVKADAGLASIETKIKKSGDGWSVLREYRDQKAIARKDAVEVSRIDAARTNGDIPKINDAVDIENKSGQITSKGTMTGSKKKSITYKDGRGKQLTASVYQAHKQGSTTRPIVKNAIPDEAAPIVDELEQISIAVRDQQGKGYIVDMDGVEWGMGGKGDDIFTGRGMLRVYNTRGKQPPVLTKNVREILDSNRTVIWERKAAGGADEVKKPITSNVASPDDAAEKLSDIQLAHRINTLGETAEKMDKRTTKYKRAVEDLGDAYRERKVREDAGTWMKKETTIKLEGDFAGRNRHVRGFEGMSAAERESRREKMLKGSVDADMLDDAVDDVPDFDTFRRALKNVAQRLEKGSLGSGGEVTNVEKAIARYLDTFDDPAKAADELFGEVTDAASVPRGIFETVDDVAEVVPTGPSVPNIYPNKMEDVDPDGKLWVKKIMAAIKDKEVSPPGGKISKILRLMEGDVEGGRLVPITRPKNVEEAKQLVDDLEESQTFLRDSDEVEEWTHAERLANEKAADKQADYADELKDVIRAYGDDIGVEGLPYEKTYIMKLGDDEKATLHQATVIKGDDFELYELEDGRGAIQFTNADVENKIVYYPDFESAQADYAIQVNKARKGEAYSFVASEAKVADATSEAPAVNLLDDPRTTNELKFRKEEINNIFDAGIDKRTNVYRSLLKEKEQIEDVLIYRKGRTKTTKKGDLGDEDIVEHLPEKGDAAPEGVLDDAAPEGVTDDVVPEGAGDGQISFIDNNGKIKTSDDFAKQMEANKKAREAGSGDPPEGVTDDLVPEGMGDDGGGVQGYLPGLGDEAGGIETTLQKAIRLRQEGIKLINKTDATGKDFDKGIDLLDEAQELEASKGLIKEVGSYTGELTSNQNAIERLRIVINAATPGPESIAMKMGRKALGLKPRVVSSKAQKESALRTLKTIEARRDALTGKIQTSSKIRKKLQEQLRDLEKGDTSDSIRKQINEKRWEIIKEEQTTGLGVESLAPVEQLQALQNEAARLGRQIEDAEAGFMPGIASEHSQKRFEDVNRSIEWIKKVHEERYLYDEKKYMADQLYETGMKAHRELFQGIEKDATASHKKVKELISKGADAFGDDVQKELKFQSQLQEQAMNKRKDVGDAVQSLIFPDGSSGILPSFQDFENIMTSRGFIGQHFEDMLNSKITAWGLKHVLATIRSSVGYVDNSFVLRSDPLGRKIIALRKLENFARTQDAADANKIMSLGKLPFELNDEGRWISRGVDQGYLADIFEHPEGFKHLFNAEQLKYVQTNFEVMDSVRKFAEFYGTDIPEVWKTANKVFRKVISSKNGIIDFNALKRWKSAKPSSFHDRFYETILDGVAKGVRYEFEPGKAVIHQMQAIRSYAVHQAFMREVGKDFGVVRELLRDQSLAVNVAKWKKIEGWASRLLESSDKNLGRLVATIPRGGIRPDINGLELPNDLKAIRNRLLANADQTDAAVKDTEAISIKNAAGELLERYRNGWGGEGENTTGLIPVQKAFKKNVAYVESMNMTKEHKTWGVRELHNETPDGQRLGFADQKWNMPNQPETMFLQDDLDYLAKHWEDSDFDRNFLKPVGRVAGVLRIPQTALDWGFPLINGLNNWGYDMYRSLDTTAKGDFKANPLLYPVFKLLGNKYKNLDSTSIWGESVWQSTLSFMSEKGAAKYWTREKALSPEIMSAYQKYARVAGLPHEFQELQTFEKAEKLVVGSIPGLKGMRGFERFQQGFTQYLNVASYMYFKSLYHTVADNPKNLESLGALSRNMIGMHAGSELGIGAGQQAMERILFYAPSFTRASFAIMANATFQPTTFQGRQAIKSLAGLGESMIMITAAYSIIQQFEENGWDIDKMNWEDLGDDMVKAWTPGKGFWGIEGSSGVVGLGGAMRSNTQLIFRLLNRGFDWSPNVKSFVKGEEGFLSAVTSDFAIHPDKWLPNPFREGPIRDKTQVTREARDEADDLGLTGDKKAEFMNMKLAEWRSGQNKDGFFDHPVMQYFRSKAGILSGNAWDIISGHDFLGYTTHPFNIPERLESFLPFYLQAVLENRQADLGTLIKTGLLEFFGARVIPPSASELKNKQWEKDSGYTIEELYEVGPDGYGEHQGLLFDLANNREKFPESVDANDLVAETNRGREADYQKFRDERTRHYQARDAQIADLVAPFSWNDPKEAERIIKGINSLYDGAQALVDEARDQIFGSDGKEVVELWEGLDVDTMSPQAALDYAANFDNWKDEVSGETKWDIREAFINKHVLRLPPDERAIWYLKEASHVGQSDVENYAAGKYDFVNEFIERKRLAGDDYGKIIDSGKYIGMSKERGLLVDRLVDTVNEARRIMISQGMNKYTNKEMLLALNKAIPGSQIIQYALMTTYDHLKPTIMSTEKFDIIMRNPDVVIFYPDTYFDWSLSDRQREQWDNRWSAFGSMGGIQWSPGTTVYNNLYRDEEGVMRNFGPDVDVTHRPRTAGIPTTTEPYTEAAEGALGAVKSIPGLLGDAKEKIQDIGDEYLPSFLR